MKKILYVLMLILLSFSVFAGVSPTSEWLKPGRSDDSRFSILPDEMNANFGATVASSDSYAVGQKRTTVSGDIDNDGQMEIVLSSANNILTILNYELNNIYLEFEHIFEAAINNTIILGQVNDDLFYELASVLDEKNLTVYNYNGTDITILCNLEIPGGIASLPFGLDQDLTGPGITNYYRVGVANKTDSIYYMRVYESNIDFGTSADICVLESPIVVAAGVNVFGNIRNRHILQPVTGDINRDGNDDVVIVCDISGNNDPGICALSGGYYPSIYGGGIDNISSASLAVGDTGTGVITGVTTYNVDGSGYAELCVSYYGYNWAVSGDKRASMISCYNIDGSLFLFKRAYPGDNTYTYMSNLVMIDVNADGYSDLCVVTQFSSLKSNLTCYNVANKSASDRVIINYGTSSTLLQQDTLIAGADLNGDGYGDIIAGGHIYFTGPGGTVTRYLYEETSTGYMTSIADVDNDGFLEIMMQAANTLKILDSNATNQPPTINSSLAYGGYLGWYNAPVCVNTTITFRGYDTSTYSTGNYWNDIPSEYERLRTTCGGLYTTDQYGTYSVDSPSFSCWFNTSGIYPVFLYLEDGMNVDYTGAYNTQAINVNVINGIPGVTCNIASSFISTIAQIQELTPATTTATQQTQDVEELFDILTFGSARLKLVVGVMLILTMVFTLAAYGVRNGLVFAVVIVFMSIVNVMFSLFPVYLLLIILCGMLLVLLIGKFILHNNSGE